MLVVGVTRGRVTSREKVQLDITLPRSLVSYLRSCRIDTLVCGGLEPETRDALTGERVSVIDNVACSVDQVMAAIFAGRLESGYGLSSPPDPALEPTVGPEKAAARRDPALDEPNASPIDCLVCPDRVCLAGRDCAAGRIGPRPELPAAEYRMLEAATDISCEEERKLCRLAELVYFCLEMRFERIGIAFCEELREPAEILDGVLRRSLQTVPVCCLAGGSAGDLPEPPRDAIVPPVTCSPLAQAGLLNHARTDLNVIVGLCMGADCLFTQASEAPVTTLFVKDRQLANNPIGAAYSEYYLRESATTYRPPSTREEPR
jgi:uncharacterized metal-binding protein